MTSPLSLSKDAALAAEPTTAGAPGPAFGRLGAMPGVNLMPPEIAERAALRQLKGGCAAALALAVVVVGGLYFQAHTGVTTANQGLAAAQAQQAQVQSEVTRLQPVAAAYAAVQAAKAQVAEALSGEIRWSAKLDDLSLSVPANVWLTSMNVAAGSATPAAPAGGAASGYGTPGIDTITFQGVASSRNDVATWLERLVVEKGYANPYVTVTQETVVGQKVLIDFTSTVTVTTAALSGRYTTPSGG